VSRVSWQVTGSKKGKLTIKARQEDGTTAQEVVIINNGAQFD
jgi:hypothetical protein